MDLKDIQKDVDAMTKVFDGQPGAGEEESRTDPPPTDPPKTEPAPTDPPSTEAPGTDSPPTQAPETEPVATDPPETEAPATEAPEEDERDKEIRELREKLALKESKPDPTKAPPTSAPPTEAPISDEDFLGDIDLDELTRDPAMFNKVLNEVYKKGLASGTAAMRKADELIIRSMPDIVKNNLALVTQLKKVNEQFYKDNADLKPFQKVVGAVFEELIAESPDKGYEELLPKVAEETRSRLELTKRATSKDRDKVPPLPRKKKGQRQQPKPDTTQLQDELSEMDKVLDL